MELGDLDSDVVQALANASAVVLDLQRVPRDVIDAELEYSALVK
jgi:hypothetical protein